MSIVVAKFTKPAIVLAKVNPVVARHEDMVDFKETNHPHKPLTKDVYHARTLRSDSAVGSAGKVKERNRKRVETKRVRTEKDLRKI